MRFVSPRFNAQHSTAYNKTSLTFVLAHNDHITVTPLTCLQFAHQVLILFAKSESNLLHRGGPRYSVLGALSPARPRKKKKTKTCEPKHGEKANVPGRNKPLHPSNDKITKKLTLRPLSAPLHQCLSIIPLLI